MASIAINAARTTLGIDTKALICLAVIQTQLLEGDSVWLKNFERNLTNKAVFYALRKPVQMTEKSTLGHETMPNE